MQELHWAWQKQGCCGCARLPRLDPAAVTAMEAGWDSFLLYLPWADTALLLPQPPT